MRIYLVGYSYSGKSTLGRKLADLLGLRFFDTDKAVELKYHTTIPLLFERYGEEAFRILERQVLFSTADLDNAVVATGGGTPCCDENINFILKSGLVIYLKMDTDDILQRLASTRKKRPLLMNKSPEQQRLFINDILQKRMPFYSQAHITTDAMTATADTIATLIRDYHAN
jgi:shikimate kinase